MKPPYAIGSVPSLKKNLNAPRPSEHPPVRGKKCQNVYWVTQLRTDGVHSRESAGTGPVNLKVVPNGCCLGRSSSSSSSSPLYCLRENISFDTLIRRSSRGHNSRKATQPSHCGTCLILLIFIAKRVQPSLPSSTLRSNFVYPRQISRSPRVGHRMS